uniref:Uncharacterized protein n=1 Tax=viral metagenome TaxID=1070528 RepID=A0A6M3IJ43_9ZZZZ
MENPLKTFEKKLNKNPTLRKDLTEAKRKIAKHLLDKLEQKNLQEKEIRNLIEKHGRKKFIEDSIIAYRAWHNIEYLEHLKYILKLRKLQANKYASTPDGEFRILFKLPTNVYNYLNRFLEPRFPLDNKESKWFARKFPEFCVCEKI